MWVIEGGARDDALAVMLKVHHAVVDGVAGANLLARLCGLEPDAPPPQPVRGAGSGNSLQIAASGLKGFASRPLRLATVVPATMLTLTQTLLRAGGPNHGRTVFRPTDPVQRPLQPAAQYRLHPARYAGRQEGQEPVRRDH
jgi:diacylglycerol O-acyltransferase / wax synthase